MSKATAWESVISDWVERERSMYPDAPIMQESVEVRDAIEIDDNAYVLVSYDVDYPWPKEEDAPGEARTLNTAVIKAHRVRQPWIERDASRAMVQSRTEDGVVMISEHPLGDRHAFSGRIEKDVDRVRLEFDSGESAEAEIVDGWFLVVTPETSKLTAIVGLSKGEEKYRSERPVRDEPAVMPGPSFVRQAGRAMYFSPRDLRGVIPLAQWERVDGLVIVAVCLEHYDDGGILRLRIDGVRPDDDMLIEWPHVRLEVDGRPLASAVCGEYSLADTISMDIGFRPWLPSDVDTMTITVEGLRGPVSTVARTSLDVSLR